jgi:hypothetical protein
MMCTICPPPYPCSSSSSSSSHQTHLFPPDYTPTPQSSERTLCSTTRRPTSRSSISADIPTGTSVHKLNKHLTLVLENQLKDHHGECSSAVRVPKIGATREVRGSVLLDDDERVGRVEVKIEGTMCMVLDTGPKKINLVSISQELYNRSSPQSTLTSSASCPPILPFSIPFSSTYLGPQHPWSTPTPTSNSSSPSTPETYSYELPPSLNIHLHSDTCTVYAAKVEYRVVVTVWYGYAVKVPLLAGKEMQVGWKKVSHLTVIHIPRSQPRYEAIQDPFPLVQSVKMQPEGWRQVSSVIPSSLPEPGLNGGLNVDVRWLSSLLSVFLSFEADVRLSICSCSSPRR